LIAATEVIFAQRKERGAWHGHSMRVPIDAAMGKNGLLPSGLRPKSFPAALLVAHLE
jgi:hypothetical protein